MGKCVRNPFCRHSDRQKKIKGADRQRNVVMIGVNRPLSFINTERLRHRKNVRLPSKLVCNEFCPSQCP